MLDPKDPLIQLKITSSVSSAVAIAATTFRLWVRRGRLWWDDAFAGFSMLALFAQVAAVFMHIPDPTRISRANRVASYYLMATTFYAIIWWARLAIIYSIIRLDPSPSRRKRLHYVSALFVLAWLVLTVQLFWICEPEQGWKDQRNPQCVLNKQVAICQLVSDIIADGLLIAAPLRLLQDLEDKVLRRRLVVIFSTCIVTTIVSLVHAAYIIHQGGIKVVIAALVEDCVSLIVCNLPVVVAATISLREQPGPRLGVDPSTSIKFASQKTQETKVEGTVRTGGLDSQAVTARGTECEVDGSSLYSGAKDVPDDDEKKLGIAL